MNSAVYDVLAEIGKYWFIALMLLILTRLCLSVSREMRIENRVEREIAHAGASIVATLILASDESMKLKKGRKYALEKECTLGRSRKCDLCLRVPSLSGIHAILRTTQNGLEILTLDGALVVVDGVLVQRRALAEDGATIQMGGLIFRLRLEDCGE